MKGKRKSPEHEIKQLLEESKAENDALKKLIAALHEKETKKSEAGQKTSESSQFKPK